MLTQEASCVGAMIYSKFDCFKYNKNNNVYVWLILVICVYGHNQIYFKQTERLSAEVYILMDSEAFYNYGYYYFTNIESTQILFE